MGWPCQHYAGWTGYQSELGQEHLLLHVEGSATEQLGCVQELHWVEVAELAVSSAALLLV